MNFQKIIILTSGALLHSRAMMVTIFVFVVRLPWMPLTRVVFWVQVNLLKIENSNVLEKMIRSIAHDI